MDEIRVNYDAIYLGAFGDPRVPDMKHAADILLGMRFQLDLYVNYRPVKLLDDRLSPLKSKGTKEIDFVIFRENTEGAYVGMGGNFKKGTQDEIAVQEDVSTRRGVERIIRYAFEFAKRTGHLTPASLGRAAKALPAGVPLYVTHMKPGFEERITSEVKALGNPALRPVKSGERLKA